MEVVGAAERGAGGGGGRVGAGAGEEGRPGGMSSEVGGPGLEAPYEKGPQAPKGPTKCMQK